MYKVAWIEDLSICDERHNLFAVGWLADNQPFSTGEVSEAFFEKLCALLLSPWNPPGPVTAGYHRCELCQFTGGAEITYYKQHPIRAWSSNSLYVPGQGRLYVSPVSIAHYVDAHRYQPPLEYVEAVLNCPKMRSMAYHKAVLENGGRGLGKTKV